MGLPRAAVITFLVIDFTLLLACNKAPEPPPDRPRLTPNVRMQDVWFDSAALRRGMPYRVILPVNIPAGVSLPVVYLLHGGGGGYRDWSNYSDVAHFAERGFILIMPEGESSYYVNAAARPNDRFEDYIVNDLIADVESRFPAARDRANRSIVGVSMGGIGAVSLALKHPDLFVFAAGISSAIDVPSRGFSIKRIGQYRAHAAIFGSWGSKHRRQNDPFVLARTAEPKAASYFFLTCGDQEGLLPANKKFAALLGSRGFKYEFHAGPGGHDWNQWNRRVPELFRSLSQHVILLSEAETRLRWQRVILGLRRAIPSWTSMLYVLQSGSVLKTDMLSLAQEIKNPVWSVCSPDGQQIAIEDDRGGNQRTLWVVRADGSQPEQLLDYLGATHDGLDWTHDGKAIILAGLAGDRLQLFSEQGSGGKPVQLTHDSGNLMHPRVRLIDVGSPARA